MMRNLRQRLKSQSQFHVEPGLRPGQSGDRACALPGSLFFLFSPDFLLQPSVVVPSPRIETFCALFSYGIQSPRSYFLPFFPPYSNKFPVEFSKVSPHLSCHKAVTYTSA